VSFSVGVAYASQGTITVSSETITLGTGQVIMVVVSDPNLAVADSKPPHVTCNLSMKLNGNSTTTLRSLPMHQAEDGSWIGFIAVNQPPQTVPANPPRQEKTPPSDGWAATDAEIAEGKEPNMDLFTANYIVALVEPSNNLITLTYHDRSEASTIEVNVKIVTGWSGTISLDKDTYPPTIAGSATVYITVVDPDWSIDPTVQDIIPNSDDLTINVSGITNSPKVGSLIEDNLNSGVFTAMVSLGPPAEARYGETLQASYMDTTDYVAGEVKTRKAYAIIMPYTGSLEFDKPAYDVKERAILTLRDSDLNLDSNAIDKAVVKVSSDADLGFLLTLEEISENAGEFVGFLYFSLEESKPDEALLKVRLGGEIYARYQDSCGAMNNPVNIEAKAGIIAHTGNIEVNLGPGPFGTIKVTDPDLDVNPEIPDVVEGGEIYVKPNVPGLVYVSSSTEPDKYFTVTVIEQTSEEDNASGIFIGYFTVSGTSSQTGETPTLLVQPGCTIKAVYHDAADDAGSPKILEDSFIFRTHTGKLSLDKQRYSPGCKVEDDAIRTSEGSTVKITLEDPDLNIDPNAKDIIPNGLVIASIKREKQTIFQADISSLFSEVEPGKFQAKYRIPSAAEAGDILVVTYKDPFDDAGLQQDQVAKVLILPYTGMLKVEPEEVAINGKIKITLIDPDMNQDPDVAETIPDCRNVGRWGGVDYWTSSVRPEQGWQLWLTETGPDTGEFTCELKVGADWLTMQTGQVKIGDTLYFRYNDDACINGQQLHATVKVRVISTSGKIWLDKSEYPLNGQVIVRIEDPDQNIDPESIQKIPASSMRLFVKTTSHIQPVYLTAEETGPDTGIFEARVTLNSGIPAHLDDGIFVAYLDEVNAEGKKDVWISANGKVRQHTTIISFDKIVYIPEEEAIITLTDSDLNLDSQVIDKVEVSIFSDSDPAGIRIILTETKSDSGIFKGSVTLAKEPSQGLKLHIEPYDRITARYVDESADPKDIDGWVWGKPTQLTVKARARVFPEHGLPITIIELATINPETGEKVEKVEVGKSVLITAGLKKFVEY
jgi:hypothetical protein